MAIHTYRAKMEIGRHKARLAIAISGPLGQKRLEGRRLAVGKAMLAAKTVVGLLNTPHT